MANKKDNKNTKNSKNSHPTVMKTPLTLSQRAADKTTEWVGSWGFILGLLILMGIWMWINLAAWKFRWDPYPFILLNFVLSTLAAIQAPIILMSQNRQAERDRVNAKYDYQVNRKAEREIQKLQKDINSMRRLLDEHLPKKRKKK